MRTDGVLDHVSKDNKLYCLCMYPSSPVRNNRNPSALHDVREDSQLPELFNVIRIGVPFAPSGDSGILGEVKIRRRERRAITADRQADEFDLNLHHFIRLTFHTIFCDISSEFKSNSVYVLSGEMRDGLQSRTAEIFCSTSFCLWLYSRTA